jgi:hypothetical protein
MDAQFRAVYAFLENLVLATNLHEFTRIKNLYEKIFYRLIGLAMDAQLRAGYGFLENLALATN